MLDSIEKIGQTETIGMETMTSTNNIIHNIRACFLYACMIFCIVLRFY